MINPISLGKNTRILSQYSPQFIKNTFFKIQQIFSTYHTAYQLAMINIRYKSPIKTGDKVLFWETGGMPALLTIDAIIAFALKLRGVNVHMVLCDGTYQACIRRDIRSNIPISEWPKICQSCKFETTKLMKVFRLPYSYIGDHVDNIDKIDYANYVKEIQQLGDLENIIFDSLKIGNQIKSAIERYLMGCGSEETVQYEQIIQEYSYSGLICASSASNVIKTYNPSHIFMTHGIYVDWGPARLVGRSKNIPLISWGESYLQGHYFFGHNTDKTRMDVFNMSEKSWNYYKNNPLRPDQVQRLEKYFENRYIKNLSLDFRNLPKYSNDAKKIMKDYVSDNNQPKWAIFSHIFWDNASDFSPLAYSSFNEWMIDTIDTITDIPDINWLIKIHPAEVWWGDGERGVRYLIKQNFPSLPENIKIIPPNATINPLDFYSIIDGGITSCGTVGMELSVLGKPVIIAARPHYSGKGFTYDGFNPDEYRKLLKNVKNIGPLDEGKKILAKKYAYCYFIRKQIPLTITLSKDPKQWVGYINFQKAKTLIQNHDPFIDFICEKIFDGSDFVMDERLIEIAENLETR